MEEKLTLLKHLQAFGLAAKSFFGGLFGKFADATVEALEKMDAAKESVNNKTTTIDASSTDEQYPSAKAVWKALGSSSGGSSGGSPGASQADWEEADEGSPAFLKNKPFGEESFSVSWDGTPTGEPVMLQELPWYLIESVTPDPDSLKNVVSDVETDAGRMTFQTDPMLRNGILYFEAPALSNMYASFIAYDGNEEGIVPGLYCIDLAVLSGEFGANVRSAQISWVQVKRIDQSYLPFGRAEEKVSWSGDTSWRDQLSYRIRFLDMTLQYYKISNLTPTLEEIATVKLETTAMVDGVPVKNTVDLHTGDENGSYGIVAGENGFYAFAFQDLVNIPIFFVVPAAGNYQELGNQPIDAPSAGIYCMDPAVAAQLFQADSMDDLEIRWQKIRKIAPEYLPTDAIKIKRYKCIYDKYWSPGGTLDEPIDESCDMIVLVKGSTGDQVMLTTKSWVRGKVVFDGFTGDSDIMYWVQASGSEYSVAGVIDNT